MWQNVEKYFTSLVLTLLETFALIINITQVSPLTELKYCLSEKLWKRLLYFIQCLNELPCTPNLFS